MPYRGLLLTYLHQVFVPLTHDAVKGWFFDFVCPGYAFSAFHVGLLLLKNATVNKNLGFDDLCREKHVFVAYNNQAGTFVISNITGDMVRYPYDNVISFQNIVYEWEIQDAFFETNNIKPTWINCNWTWGTLNETTGQVTGATGMIHSDEADYALWGFALTYPRSKVAGLLPVEFMPYHWITRYPQELSPTWNLLGLFTKGIISQMSLILSEGYKLKK